jgi:hypothetical protein
LVVTVAMAAEMALESPEVQTPVYSSTGSVFTSGVDAELSLLVLSPGILG